MSPWVALQGQGSANPVVRLHLFFKRESVDPEMTSDVGTEWGLQIWLCVGCWLVSGTVARHKRDHEAQARAPSVRTESPVRTELHWLFQYWFNPETTSDIGTEWGLQIWLCACCLERHDRTESPIWTELHWLFQYCFNPELTSDVGTEWGLPDLIVCVSPTFSCPRNIRRPSEFLSEATGVGPKALYEPSHTGRFSMRFNPEMTSDVVNGVEVSRLDCEYE